MSSIPLPFPADDPLSSGLESVSELTARIKRALRADFSEVAVHGEISNVARPRSGHVYFTLKDEGASIRAVIWKTEARRLTFDLTDGLAVRAFGGLTLYEPRGEYQITISQIEPEGIGALELAFRQRFAKLTAEGLFDPARKRPLPRFPRKILVVTSPTGAAVRDLLQITGRRWKCAEVLIVPSRVQGVGADREVVAALQLANRVREGDVIVIARGGGSLEDLWTFNEESVVRAVVASRLPVVAAVGHEIDVTLTDLAADRRALTPSEAGEICAPDCREVALHLDRLAARLSHAGEYQLENARKQLDRLSDRATRALRQGLLDRRYRMARLAASLEALSPLGVLARGYSLTFRADDQRLVRAASEVQPGERIRTQLAAGSILSEVVTE
jgi:exodeoxyribonuclease VII large subunit